MLSHWFITDDIPLSLCIQYHQNAWLLALSYLVATFASYTAFHLTARVRAAATARARRTWLATAGVTMGLGIWAMHFIAMLAVRIPIRIGYDIELTALSAGCAMLASCTAFGIMMGSEHRRLRPLVAGLVLGGGVALMHYVGMAALRMPAHLYYNPWLFALSLAVSVALATAALSAMRDLSRLVAHPILARFIGSAVMGVAIVLMHYTGMFATYFYPDPTAPEAGLIFGAPAMAGAVGAITLSIIGIALVAALLENHRTQARDFTAALINSLPGFFVLIDQAGRLALWNENLATVTGLSDAELRGLDANALAVESDRDMMRAKMRNTFARGLATVEFGVASKSGSVHAVRWNGRVITDRGRRFLLASGLDMTEFRAAEAQLRASEQRFRTIFSSVHDGIIVLDAATGGFIDANPRLCEMFGYTREELATLDLAALSEGLSPFTREHMAALGMSARLGESLVFEWRFTSRAETRFWCAVSVRHADFGGQDVLLATLRDITERRRAYEQISHMARHDSLTGLANRGVFVAALEQAIARARRGAKGLAVLYFDLDHFKDVNDTLGHPVGDLLLQTVAERLRASVREVDTVARFGGDEFAIILTDIQDPSDAAMVSDRILHAIGAPIALEEIGVAAGVVADKILAAVSKPFLIQGNEIRSGTTIGIAIYGPESPDAETMLSHADVALYRAKSDGRGTYRFFTDAMDSEIRARVAMGNELREAIAAGQFFLAYQPQVDIDSGTIVGLEALVRWHHPTRGMLGPGSFIPAAERNGLIIPLGYWVMREACRQAKHWLDAGIAPPLISVNLSGIQFKRPLELEKNIAAILAECGLPARLIELELTESVLMETSREHNEMLIRLRKAGHRIAIDDFGSGYSSLGYLRQYPVDRLKIDQSFIADIGIVAGSDAIVRAAIGLARELDIEVIVEGVETNAQLALLKRWGARIVQGYYFSVPLLAAETTALLRTGRIAPARPGPAEIIAAA